MTVAMRDPAATLDVSSRATSLVILGTDAFVAALPATAVQLAHACHRLGFANVVPASWGDELVAAAVLRRLGRADAAPAVQCSCPIVANRLLATGRELQPALVSTVAPPVALARYLRALYQPSPLRITYAGRCPAASDESIDTRILPQELLAMLEDRGIAIEQQPRVFESVIPPDRRRFRSLPGGTPTADALWNEVGERRLVELERDDIVIELAQHLFSGGHILVDASVRLGCHCAGASPGITPSEARAQVAEFEPPRSPAPVVEERAPIDLELPMPAASRIPADLVTPGPAARPPGLLGARPHGLPEPALPLERPPGSRISPPRPQVLTPDARQPRDPGKTTPAHGTTKPVQPAPSSIRESEARQIPRMYVARRRPSPLGTQAETRSTKALRRRSGGAESPAESPGTAAPASALKKLLPWVAVALLIFVSVVLGIVFGSALVPSP